MGMFTVEDTSTFEIQHRGNSGSPYGMGHIAGGNLGEKTVYAIVELEKLE
ncbi:MAG: hypothetical protein HQK77_16870 [Desulfobacterales bacterium]|nr:hypothetical protein [Desulfobacterales bacterium]